MYQHRLVWHRRKFDKPMLHLSCRKQNYQKDISRYRLRDENVMEAGRLGNRVRSYR
ncbi:hypothetical protein LBMAG21_02080 [Armatimonadota bacterium]|nr:hypothetical protein LBMAG21_02080 [Armatimonadota bacterium]